MEIIIRRNEPFQVTPGLDQVVRAMDEVCLDQINFIEPKLVIRGSLRFLEVQPDNYSDTPFVSPAGEILPITIDATFNDLTRKQMNKIGFTLTYDSTIYRAALGGYDDLSMKHTGRADVAYWSWIDEHDKEVKLMFRREDLSKIKYTLQYPGT